MKKETGISIGAPGKINLYLDVLSKEESGYHQIVSVMQAVSLADGILLSGVRGERGITLSCSADFLPCDRRNLAYAAAQTFLGETGIEASVQIRIEKRIPVAGGMAGGSADAAAVLRGLNLLFGRPLPREALLSLAASLGADVPFCLAGGTAICTGHGEVLTPVPCALRLPLLLLPGGKESVSTPAAYAKLDEIYKNFENGGGGSPEKRRALLTALRLGDFPAAAANMYNIFEDAILPICPGAARNREALLSVGALGAMMSGSGPTVFGIFADARARDDAERRLLSMGFSPKSADSRIVENV